MKLALLQFELIIRHAESIKDKRRVVKSVKDRLHREQMLAVAEVGLLDEHTAARLAAVGVGTDVKHLQGVLSRAVEKLRCLGEGELGSFSGRIVDAPDMDEDAIDFDSLLTPAERIEMLAAGREIEQQAQRDREGQPAARCEGHEPVGPNDGAAGRVRGVAR